MNCSECQCLTQECRRRDAILTVAETTLDAVRVVGSLSDYDAARIAADEAGIESRLAHAELDLHILRHHPNGICRFSRTFIRSV